MSPSRKCAAVVQLQEEFAISERRACQVLDQPRSSQRYQAKPRDDEEAMVKQMRTWQASDRGSAIGGSPCCYAAIRGGPAIRGLLPVASGGFESAAETAEKAARGQ